MSSSSSDIGIAAALGLGFGVYSFFKGFRVYREYRVLADTPEIPIRSMPMGLVEIHGKATGEQLVPSPVTRTPCFFYKVDIERWVRDKNRGHWSHAKTDTAGTRFYLDDGTGKVLVDANGAEYDLIQTARVETGRGSSGSLGRLPWGRGDPTPALGPVGSDAELCAYVQSALSMRHSAFSVDGPSLLTDLLQGSINLAGGGSDRYRLTEFLILPGHYYDITGTCAENPNPKDEHDRNLITKGQNEPTFLISWRSEKELESALRKRAAFRIFGGAALTVACLGILLAKLGWL
jgi:hypothetical protein